MKKALFIGGLALLLTLAGSASAATPWNVTGNWVLTFAYGSNYNHDINITVQNPDGTFSGTGGYPAGGPYTITETISGVVSGNNITLNSSYDGSSYTYTATGTIASDGSMSGTLTTSASQSGPWSALAGSAKVGRYAEITSPADDENVTGTLNLAAYLVDDEQDPVQWAVRKGTCAAGTNTVLGNVDDLNTPYAWAYDSNTGMYNFTASADTSSWDTGDYCFIFNPKEDSGETDIRLTRNFNIKGSATPEIAIDKTSNAQEVDKGDTVTYTYTVTNPGDLALSDISVTDDKCSLIVYQSGDANTNNILESGETWVYACSMELNDTTTNKATVEGTDSFQETVTASDSVTVTVIQDEDEGNDNGNGGKVEREGDCINHGQYVKNAVDKKEAAHDRCGMPVQSKGHTEE
jgi:Domain of unknown function DUF11